ncbi:MAG: hypothetical protein JW793_15415 [Acidobacteria bacterium]|nr:hypothetical protein [Acidobacteriota bacterium]
MNLIPSYKLYTAAWGAIAKGVKEPRREIGQMCHHMVLDLLERAGLVKMDRVKGRFQDGQLYQTFFQRDDIDKEELSGTELTEAVNSRSLILFIDSPTPGQHPAHTLITMGDYEVAGYNNVGSINDPMVVDFISGLNVFTLSKFPWFCVSQKNKTVYGVSPEIFAQRISA